jgi:hypothetical protein
MSTDNFVTVLDSLDKGSHEYWQLCNSSDSLDKGSHEYWQLCNSLGKGPHEYIVLATL